jgi:hypothetical protein
MRNKPGQAHPRKLGRNPSGTGKRSIDRFLYVSLPAEVIPRKMLDGRLAIVGLSMTMSFADDRRHAVSILHHDPRVNLYALDKPLEAIQVEYVSHVNELLVLRNWLMLMAMNLGLEDEVPSSTIHTTWPQLASKILMAIGLQERRPTGRKSKGEFVA